MAHKLFLDTSYAIALSSARDEFHPKALELAAFLERERISIVTTRAVLLEIGNALSKLRYRRAAIDLLLALEADPTIEIAPVSESLYQQGLTLFRQRQDKEWGLTDCLSFVVMAEQGITGALTADDHFRQAGFHALMRNDK